MAVSGNGYFIHAQHRGWIPPTGDRFGMPQWEGRGATTNPEYMGEYGLDHLHHMRICAEVIQQVIVFTTIPAARLRQSRIVAW